VWKWVTGDTRTFPATFAASLEQGGVVSARWLLTGEGNPEPAAPDSAPLRLQVIGKLTNGSVDDATVREIAERLSPPPMASAGGTLGERLLDEELRRTSEDTAEGSG